MTQIGTISMPDGSAVSYDALPNANFRLIFPKTPIMVMFLQEFTVPEVSVTEVIKPTPYMDMNEIGEKIRYGNVRCSFLVDKNLKNYKEIFNWMRRMTVAGSNIGETDDPVLIINGTDMIRFVGAWPLSLSGLSFVANETDVKYMTASVDLNFDYMEFVDQPFHVTNP